MVARCFQEQRNLDMAPERGRTRPLPNIIAIRVSASTSYREVGS